MERDGGKVMDVGESFRLVGSTNRCGFLRITGVLPQRAARMLQEAWRGDSWPHLPAEPRWLAGHTEVWGVSQGMFRRPACVMAAAICQLAQTVPLADPDGRGRRLVSALPPDCGITREQPGRPVGQSARPGAGVSGRRFPRRSCA